jgi:MbtH protein
MNEENYLYYVVVNQEEQYSIWPEFKEIPKGWKKVGRKREKSQCLDYIEKVWKDMRPLSLRKVIKRAS